MQRRITYGLTPTALDSELTPDVVRGGWFELQREGGCGSGQLKLQLSFERRDELLQGGWIAIELEGVRWYLGRIERTVAEDPYGLTLSLAGMAVQLNEIFVGGFGIGADGQAPHRFSQLDLFGDDPDHGLERVDDVTRPEDLLRLVLEDYVAPNSAISLSDERIEESILPQALMSAKFRGEESVRSILKDLALRAGAHWGVDELGRFYFYRPRDAVQTTWRLGRDLESLRATADRDRLFNRLLLTGDYIYSSEATSAVPGSGSFRWRGNYRQPESIARYGERRIRMWTPWIRTAIDARGFATEFFRRYATPAVQYDAEPTAWPATLRPWLGQVALQTRSGAPLATVPLESLRVQLGTRVSMLAQLGVGDPREFWPEPTFDERFPIAPSGTPGFGGDDVSDSGLGGGDDDGGGGGGSSTGSATDSASSSDLSSSLDSSESSSAAESSSLATVPGPSGCERVARFWSLSLSTLADGTASPCADLNGTHTLEYVSGPPTWLWRATLPAIGGVAVTLELTTLFSGWELVARSTHNLVIYRATSRVCLGPNSLSRISQAGDCVAWPATVVLTPA